LGEGNKKKIGECCSAVNSSIHKIKLACRDSRQVVQAAYEKLVVILETSIVSVLEKQPFIHVDYSIDTVYMELNWLSVEDRKRLFLYLSKVKHFAMNECNMRDTELKEADFWDILCVSCPALERVTFIIQ
jgi:hypothetical protein